MIKLSCLSSSVFARAGIKTFSLPIRAGSLFPFTIPINGPGLPSDHEVSLSGTCDVDT